MQFSSIRPHVLFIDLKTTMNTLLNTIHNANRTNNAVGFKGFNFLNYDLRSFSSLNSATGGSISNVGVYLVYNNAGTGHHSMQMVSPISWSTSNLTSKLYQFTGLYQLERYNRSNGNTGAPTSQCCKSWSN